MRNGVGMINPSIGPMAEMARIRSHQKRVHTATRTKQTMLALLHSGIVATMLTQSVGGSVQSVPLPRCRSCWWCGNSGGSKRDVDDDEVSVEHEPIVVVGCTAMVGGGGGLSSIRIRWSHSYSVSHISTRAVVGGLLVAVAHDDNDNDDMAVVPSDDDDDDDAVASNPEMMVTVMIYDHQMM